MDSFKALAILAFCAGTHAAALPQFPGLFPAGLFGPLSGLPGLPPGLLPRPSSSPRPRLPPIGGLPFGLPFPNIPLPFPLPIPGLATAIVVSPNSTATSSPPSATDALNKAVDLGTEVLESVLDVIAPGLPLLPPPLLPQPAVVEVPESVPVVVATTVPVEVHETVPVVVPTTISVDVPETVPVVVPTTISVDVPESVAVVVPTTAPVAVSPNGTLPLSKRQLFPPASSPAPGLGGLLGGLSGGTGVNPLNTLGSTLGNAVGGLLTPVNNVLAPVASALAPVTGAVTGALAPLTSALAPVSGLVGSVANAVGSVPGLGPAVAPILNSVGGIVGGVNPLGAVSSLTSSVPLVGPLVGSIVNGLPVLGGADPTPTGSVAIATATSSSAIQPNINPLPFQGIPGTDPVGAFSIAVIATLLSLLKKDPLSLFAPSLPIPGLVKRDLPELHRRDIPELARRQLSGLPSLSANTPGVGVGSLPLSGVPGVPPDLAYLVGSIAKNIALPSGGGLGSVTNSILGILNGVVPNFLFQLPVVQDAVPAFGVLQLLSSINPTKFGSLASLSSLGALQQAATSITGSDLAVVRNLPTSSDPSNLITTIMTLSDNILSLVGRVVNLKASVAVLCMKILGLSVPGL